MPRVGPAARGPEQQDGSWAADCASEAAWAAATAAAAVGNLSVRARLLPLRRDEHGVDDASAMTVVARLVAPRAGTATATGPPAMLVPITIHGAGASQPRPERLNIQAAMPLPTASRRADKLPAARAAATAAAAPGGTGAAPPHGRATARPDEPDVIITSVIVSNSPDVHAVTCFASQTAHSRAASRGGRSSPPSIRPIPAVPLTPSAPDLSPRRLWAGTGLFVGRSLIASGYPDGDAFDEGDCLGTVIRIADECVWLHFRGEGRLTYGGDQLQLLSAPPADGAAFDRYSALRLHSDGLISAIKSGEPSARTREALLGAAKEPLGLGLFPPTFMQKTIPLSGNDLIMLDFHSGPFKSWSATAAMHSRILPISFDLEPRFLPDFVADLRGFDLWGWVLTHLSAGRGGYFWLPLHLCFGPSCRTLGRGTHASKRSASGLAAAGSSAAAHASDAQTRWVCFIIRQVARHRLPCTVLIENPRRSKIWKLSHLSALIARDLSAAHRPHRPARRAGTTASAVSAAAAIRQPTGAPSHTQQPPAPGGTATAAQETTHTEQARALVARLASASAGGGHAPLNTVEARSAAGSSEDIELVFTADTTLPAGSRLVVGAAAAIDDQTRPLTLITTDQCMYGRGTAKPTSFAVSHSICPRLKCCAFDGTCGAIKAGAGATHASQGHVSLKDAFVAPHLCNVFHRRWVALHAERRRHDRRYGTVSRDTLLKLQFELIAFISTQPDAAFE